LHSKAELYEDIFSCTPFCLRSCTFPTVHPAFMILDVSPALMVHGSPDTVVFIPYSMYLVPHFSIAVDESQVALPLLDCIRSSLGVNPISRSMSALDATLKLPTL